MRSLLLLLFVAHLSGGAALAATLAPGEVEIAQYGQPEGTNAYRNTGFWAVRFDPPFDPPYRISKIAFPSATFNGVPAVFPSVRLCPANGTTGTPNISAPLLSIAPFTGSANGENVIPVGLPVVDAGRTFYVCVEFPSTSVPGFPNNFPYLAQDTDMDRGYFGTSFTLTASGAGAGGFPDRNLVVSLFCQMASPDEVPIESSSNLGTNRIGTDLVFTFRQPDDIRADGLPMARNSLRRTDLLWRQGTASWQVYASTGSGSNSFKVNMDSLPGGGAGVWATQAVDKADHRAIPSSVVITSNPHLPPSSSFGYDADEPNGRIQDAAPFTLPLPQYTRDETIFPAGDQDFYSFYASPGDLVDVGAGATGAIFDNSLDLVMFLYDNRGDIVALSDNANGGPNPWITYTVPRPSRNSRSTAARKLTVQVADIRGSQVAPDGAPRVTVPITYVVSVRVLPQQAGSAHLQRNAAGDGFAFRALGAGPTNPQAKLVYALPRSANGTRVVLRVYDVRGRLVRTLADRIEQTGVHTVAWDGTDNAGRRVSSGMYFARIEAGSFRDEAKVLILR